MPHKMQVPRLAALARDDLRNNSGKCTRFVHRAISGLRDLASQCINELDVSKWRESSRVPAEAKWF